MRAALYDHTGPAREVLRVAEIGRPPPGPGEVRVRISLSGVNPTDWKARGGAVPRPIDDFQIPHQDGAGVLDAVNRRGKAIRCAVHCARLAGEMAARGIVFVIDDPDSMASPDVLT